MSLVEVDIGIDQLMMTTTCQNTNQDVIVDMEEL